MTATLKPDRKPLDEASEELPMIDEQ